MGCMNRLERECNGTRWWDLKAGDAVLSYGETWSWTVFQNSTWTSLSLKFIPGDLLYTGEREHHMHGSYYPWKCTPLGGTLIYPIIYPSSGKNRTDTEPVFPVWPRNADLSYPIAALRELRDSFIGDCGIAELTS